MAKSATSRKVVKPAAVATIVSYQPAGVRKRGRGIAYEWPLKAVLKFVEKGIALKQAKQAPPGNAYVVAYDRVRLRTLEMVRRWLLKAELSGQPIVEVPSLGTPEERYDMGGHTTVAAWFARLIHDRLHASVYCPKCKKSYPLDRLKFVILAPCPSGRMDGDHWHSRAPTGEECPKGHLLFRH